MAMSKCMSCNHIRRHLQSQWKKSTTISNDVTYRGIAQQKIHIQNLKIGGTHGGLLSMTSMFMTDGTDRTFYIMLMVLFSLEKRQRWRYESIQNNG